MPHMSAADPDNSVELLRRIQTGDQQAWEALYLRYRDPLLFSIRCRLGAELRARIESEDVLHSVVRAAMHDLHEFQPQGEQALSRYLHVCVLNKIRKKAAFHAAQKRANEVPLSDVLLAQLPQSGAGPSYLDDERWEQLERAMAGLPPEMREAVVLRSIEGLSNSEAAQELGKSPEATSKLFNRAIARMGISIDGGAR